MCTIVGVGNKTPASIGLPTERAIVSPEEGGVVTSGRVRRYNLLSRIDLEDVGGVIDRKGITPVEHSADRAIARPVEAELGSTRRWRTHRPIGKGKVSGGGGIECCIS